LFAANPFQVGGFAYSLLFFYICKMPVHVIMSKIILVDYSKKASWYKLPEAAKDVDTNNK